MPYSLGLRCCHCLSIYMLVNTTMHNLTENQTVSKILLPVLVK